MNNGYRKISWKEFLKPTIGKIILTLVLTAVFAPFGDFDQGIRCITAPCPSGPPMIIFYLMALFKGYGDIHEIHYLEFVIGVIASYLFSCIIILIFKKLKK